MKIAKKAALAAVAVIFCGLVFSVDSMAQDYAYPDQAYPPQLTQEQQTALRQIINEHTATTENMRQALNAKRAELRAQMDSENPDKGKIATLAREIGEIRGKLLSARVDMRQKLAQAGIPVEAEDYGPQAQQGPQGYYPGGNWGGNQGYGHHGWNHPGWGYPCWGHHGCWGHGGYYGYEMPGMMGPMMMGPMRGW